MGRIREHHLQFLGHGVHYQRLRHRIILDHLRTYLARTRGTPWQTTQGVLQEHLRRQEGEFVLQDLRMKLQFLENLIQQGELVAKYMRLKLQFSGNLLREMENLKDLHKHEYFPSAAY